jgi:hypothetical protein
MGLLDDAIREHLEFKRRGGADPSEVLRLEREAFDPVPGAPPAEAAAPAQTAQTAVSAAGFEELRAARMGQAPDPPAAPDLHPRLDPAHLSQETVEFDMRAALDAEAASTDDSLEWEMPGERPRGFSGRPFEEAPAPRRRIVDAPAPAPVEVPAGAGMPDSPDGASDQESLWRDRRTSREGGFEFER